MYKNLIFGINKLFKWSIFIISYTSVLHNIFKYAFGKCINSKYMTKSLVLNICYFVDQIRKDLIM